MFYNMKETQFLETTGTAYPVTNRSIYEGGPLIFRCIQFFLLFSVWEVRLRTQGWFNIFIDFESDTAEAQYHNGISHKNGKVKNF